MAKGQMRSNKEKRKPKADKKLKEPSAYKQQFGAKPASVPIAQIKKPG